jgi:hypothetical protein
MKPPVVASHTASGHGVKLGRLFPASEQPFDLPSPIDLRSPRFLGKAVCG